MPVCKTSNSTAAAADDDGNGDYGDDDGKCWLVFSA